MNIIKSACIASDLKYKWSMPHDPKKNPLGYRQAKELKDGYTRTMLVETAGKTRFALQQELKKGTWRTSHKEETRDGFPVTKFQKKKNKKQDSIIPDDILSLIL